MAIALGVIVMAVAGFWLFVALLGPLPLDKLKTGSISVLDREGQLLRAYTTPDGRWRLPIQLHQVDQRYQRMLLSFEDKRFFDHPGFDILALARAFIQLVSNGRIVSGASTVTMQVARLLEGKHERSLTAKLRQIVRAVQLERCFSKQQILAAYFRLAPFGGNIEGVRAASFAYFGKEPQRLSLAEAALLVALPQSPERRRPDRNNARALSARNRVLDRLVAADVISQTDAEHAKQRPVPSERRRFPILAAHLADEQIRSKPQQLIHDLTIDRNLQTSLTSLSRQHVTTRGSRLSAAIVVVDHTSGEVLARVGSPGYLDAKRFGSIDMTRAIRSPGSTLKPFIYGLAFDAGRAHPETLIEDRPVRFGLYAPRNFDETWRGTVSIRMALQLSLNVPAVKVLHDIGPQRLAARIRSLGIKPRLPEAAVPSLATALGGLGLSLIDLTKLYVALARGGAPIALKTQLTPKRTEPTTQNSARLLSPISSWYVSDILAGTPPPKNAKGGQIAYKTGTSFGFRDAWALGFDGRHTVAVWMGRPDGAPTPQLTGLASAAPLLFDVFQHISSRRIPMAAAPEGIIQGAGQALPPPMRRFRSALPVNSTTTHVDRPVRIAFPPNRAELELVELPDQKLRPLLLKASGGKLPLAWLINGKPLLRSPRRREAYWTPEDEGFVRLSVIDANGSTDRVIIKLTR